MASTAGMLLASSSLRASEDEMRWVDSPVSKGCASTNESRMLLSKFDYWLISRPPVHALHIAGYISQMRCVGSHWAELGVKDLTEDWMSTSMAKSYCRSWVKVVGLLVQFPVGNRSSIPLSLREICGESSHIWNSSV